MKVSIFQPILTAYRLPLFNSLACVPNIEVELYSAIASSHFGLASVKNEQLLFKWHVAECNNSHSNYYAFKISKNAVSCSDVIIHFADFKHCSLFFSMFFSIFLGKKFFLHGQGGYKRSGFLHKIVYNLSLFFSDGYICYSDFSESVLKKNTLNFLHKKIHVVENSLYLTPRNIPSFGPDILFIGRLRDGCGVEILLEAAKLSNLSVRLVGGGDDDFINSLKNEFDNFIYLGALFDEEQLFKIAQDCFVGVYAGDAGLSVVHYMAYGLPVVVHNDIYKHMGPEPSYIVDKVNGLTFQRGNAQSLSDVLNILKQDKLLHSKLSKGAEETFNKLNTPPMHEKFAKIIGLKNSKVYLNTY